MSEQHNFKKCVRDPASEIFEAAGLLDAAVTSDLMGKRDIANELIRLADHPELIQAGSARHRYGPIAIGYQFAPHGRSGAAALSFKKGIGAMGGSNGWRRLHSRFLTAQTLDSDRSNAYLEFRTVMEAIMLREGFIIGI